jgi:site-specific DNA-adenine methylase
LKDIDVFLETDVHVLNYLESGDLVFLDPPYLGTKGNYMSKGVGKSGKDHTTLYNRETTLSIVRAITELKTAHYIWTYGSNASLIFPEVEWDLLKTVKVPNLRRGGTVERNEMISYSWKPQEKNVLTFESK